MNKVVILAAGKGTRMGADIPKVLIPINGRPMISYLLESVLSSGIDNKPIIIVSPDNIDIIKENTKNFNCDYVIQTEQLGTGHALSCAKSILKEKAENIIVLYGDHPLIKKDTLIGLINTHNKNKSNLTIMTAVVPNFSGWKQLFYNWGRIKRKNNKIIGIIEKKDADENELKIQEVNLGIYCFNNCWLWNNIDALTNINAQEEYYLTDMVKIAFQNREEINSISILPEETIGVNTPTELEIAKKIINI